MISFVIKLAKAREKRGKFPGKPGKPGNVPWKFNRIFPSLLKHVNHWTRWESRGYKVRYNIISLIIICSLASLAYLPESNYFQKNRSVVYIDISREQNCIFLGQICILSSWFCNQKKNKKIWKKCWHLQWKVLY